MKYVKLRVWLIFTVVVIGVILVLNYSSGGPGIYKSSSPITDSLLTESYPKLYEAISERDGQQLTPFLTHEHSKVRKQAWRALASTPVNSIEQFIELASQQNTEPAWFGISQHTLSDQQLRTLEQRWINNSKMRPGISLVLGQRGDRKSLDFLLDQLDSENVEVTYRLALAVGRLVQRFETSESEQIKIIEHSFDTENYKASLAFLYGWYRNDENELTEKARNTLYRLWQLRGFGISRKVDQFVNKLLPERTTYDMVIFYNGQQMLDDEMPLAYELARSVDQLTLDELNSLAAKILLTNTNPHVQVRTLQSLNGKMSKTGDLFTYIRDSMIPDSELSHKVWLQAVESALTVDSQVASGYMDRLSQISQQNVYLLPQVLAVYEEVQTSDEFLDRVGKIVDNEDPLSTMFALQSLQGFWQDLPSDERTDDRVQQIRSMVFQALDLSDRGVTYTAQSLLRLDELFSKEDFNRINKSLSAFTLPADVEVYQTYGLLYKDRFEQQAQSIIESWASQNYAPLNRSLANAGWDVEVPENPEPNFRMPDWQRLWELGQHPVLTLNTEKGPIEIELNTLSAPATVAMIDSMNQADNYNDISFHRVVPNFVIQGGDIERQDGFGGPDFVIPTEATEQQFVRGSVGIASAGTDTEGSQYFIMHQWKPHLNGSYTRFGEVIEGMDVVDKITEGDKVLSSTWY
jgi:cyclophilin family peptidyl-prolyl cis-trans isomerase